MQQKTIKTTWSQGGFNAAAIDQLLANITAALTTVGCTIVSSSAAHVAWMPAGCNPTDDTTDDTPHSALVKLADPNNVGHFLLRAYTVWGAAYTDVAARTTYVDVCTTFDYGGTSQISAVGNISRFYCAANGHWWLYIKQASPSTVALGAVVCTRLRRYAADTTQGVHARYGLLTPMLWYFYVPYYTAVNGLVETNAFTDVWSPMASNGGEYTRHIGSPLPASAAPLWPHNNNAASAALLGEMLDVQVLTAGDFTDEQSVSPGVIAMASAAAVQRGLALPTSSITSITDARV